MPTEVAVGRAGIDLDPNLAVPIANQLRRELGVAVEGKHLLHLELVDHNGVSGYAERFGSCRQSDLGKPRRRHDGLAEHFVVSQPGAYVGSDIGLPDMVSAGRHLDVRAEQRVGSGQLRHRRSIRDPESTVVPRCGWEIHQATVGFVRCGHADRGELGVKEQRLVLVAVHRRRDEMAAGHRPGCR